MASTDTKASWWPVAHERYDGPPIEERKAGSTPNVDERNPILETSAQAPQLLSQTVSALCGLEINFKRVKEQFTDSVFFTLAEVESNPPESRREFRRGDPG